eukprot:8979444-Alexandrium_andersonii.AAC.1
MALCQNELARGPARWVSSASELLRRSVPRCSNEGWSSSRRRARIAPPAPPCLHPRSTQRSSR